MKDIKIDIEKFRYSKGRVIYDDLPEDHHYEGLKIIYEENFLRKPEISYIGACEFIDEHSMF